ncbi:MAG: hypothetical protein ACKOW3_05010 [Hyphomicrobium sp.]
MQKRLLVGIAVTALTILVAGPTLSFAAHTPTTKNQCMKHKDMKWDKASKRCLKK